MTQRKIIHVRWGTSKKAIRHLRGHIQCNSSLQHSWAEMKTNETKEQKQSKCWR